MTEIKEYLMWLLYRGWVRPGSHTHLVLSRPDFDLQKTLADLHGPLLEVGGPTERGYFKIGNPIDFQEPGRSVFISNIAYPPPGQPSKHAIDVQADGRALPFPESSMAAVFVSAIGRLVPEGIMQEATRVLLPRGVLVWQGYVRGGEQVAHVLGFELAQHVWEMEQRIRNDLISCGTNWNTPFPCIERAIQLKRRSMQGKLGKKMIDLIVDDYKRLAIPYKQPVEVPCVVIFQKAG